MKNLISCRHPTQTKGFGLKVHHRHPHTHTKLTNEHQTKWWTTTPLRRGRFFEEKKNVCVAAKCLHFTLREYANGLLKFKQCKLNIKVMYQIVVAIQCVIFLFSNVIADARTFEANNTRNSVFSRHRTQNRSHTHWHTKR